jgi:hypothetical protein
MSGVCVPVRNDGPGYTTPPNPSTAQPMPSFHHRGNCIHSIVRVSAPAAVNTWIPVRHFSPPLMDTFVAVVAGVYVVRYPSDGPERYKVMNNARQLNEPLERCRKMPLSQLSAEYPSRSKATVALFLLR